MLEASSREIGLVTVADLRSTTPRSRTSPTPANRATWQATGANVAFYFLCIIFPRCAGLVLQLRRHRLPSLELQSTVQPPDSPSGPLYRSSSLTNWVRQ